MRGVGSHVAGCGWWVLRVWWPNKNGSPFCVTPQEESRLDQRARLVRLEQEKKGVKMSKDFLQGGKYPVGKGNVAACPDTSSRVQVLVSSAVIGQLEFGLNWALVNVELHMISTGSSRKGYTDMYMLKASPLLF